MNEITAIWRKSSYSGSSGDCVEVTQLSGGAAVRDSKDQPGPALKFTADEWRAFISDIKTGRY
jgi:hypothetical protein